MKPITCYAFVVLPLAALLIGVPSLLNSGSLFPMTRPMPPKAAMEMAVAETAAGMAEPMAEAAELAMRGMAVAEQETAAIPPTHKARPAVRRKVLPLKILRGAREKAKDSGALRASLAP